MQPVFVSQTIHEGRCACPCGCEIDFYPSPCPIAPGALCEGCATYPFGECPKCGEEGHLGTFDRGSSCVECA